MTLAEHLKDHAALGVAPLSRTEIAKAMDGIDPFTNPYVNRYPYGLHSVNARSCVPTVTTGAASYHTTCRTKHKTVFATTSLASLFDNMLCNNGGSEVVATGSITISVAIEYPLGVVMPVTFNGQTTVTIPAHSVVQHDEFQLDLPANTEFWYRATIRGSGTWPSSYLAQYVAGSGYGPQGDSYLGYISGATKASPIVISVPYGDHQFQTGDTAVIVGVLGNTAANGTWTVTRVSATQFSLNGSTGNAAYTSGGTYQGSDLALYGSAPMAGAGGTQLYGPRLLLGRPAIDTSSHVFAAICGDSIAQGSGDTGNGSGGWILRGLGSSGQFNYTRMPVTQVAVRGTTSTYFAASTGNLYSNSLRRRRQSFGAPYFFLEYGTNDLYGSARTVAQLQADNLSIAGAASRKGSKVILTTLTPRTASSDSWATAGNQSVLAQEPLRLAYNQWVRAGAPIDSATGVAVAVRTSNALLAGAAGHPIWKVIDPCQYVEVNASNVITQDGGRWLCNGTANWPTTDGTHPNAPMCELAAAAVPLSSLV